MRTHTNTQTLAYIHTLKHLWCEGVFVNRMLPGKQSPVSPIKASPPLLVRQHIHVHTVHTSPPGEAWNLLTRMVMVMVHAHKKKYAHFTRESTLILGM